MRVAGIRLLDGQGVWLDAGEHAMEPLDRVTALVNGSQIEGAVFAAPQHLLQPPERLDGVVLSVLPASSPDPDCADLPGADLPPLGTMWSRDGIEGTVVALDPVERRVTILQPDGSEYAIELAPNVV